MVESRTLPAHYRNALRPIHLARTAQARAADIVDTITAEHPVLVFTGFSGIASATALSLALVNLNFNFEMLMVRKQGESLQCHGSSVHSSTTKIHTGCCFIFVDDFVDSGLTLARMHKTVEKFGGLTYVCTDDDLCTLRGCSMPILTLDDDTYYGNLIEVNSES